MLYEDDQNVQSILSLLLAGGLCFCFRIQELVVEICVDSVVSSIVYTSTVERYGDGKGGSLEDGVFIY